MFRDLMILVTTLQYKFHCIPKEKDIWLFFKELRKNKINKDLYIVFDPVTTLPTVWQLFNIKYSISIWYFTVLMIIGHVLIWNYYEPRGRLYLYRSHSRGRSFAVPTHRTAPHTQCVRTESRCSFDLHILQRENKWKSQKILTNRYRIVFPFCKIKS